MADYDLKYTGAQIDGLLATANELKTAGYIYKGVATPSTNPGTPSERVAYLASEPGTYTNFGGIVITSGLYSLTYVSGTWTGTQMQAGSDIEVVQTTGQSVTAVMSQKAVTDSLVGSVISYDNSQSGLAADNVQGVLDEMATNVAEVTEINIDSYESDGLFIGGDGNWSGSANWTGFFVPVTAGKTYRIVSNGTTAANFAFMTARSGTSGQPVTTFATGYSASVSVPATGNVVATAPSDAKYIWLNRKKNGVVSTPELYEILYAIEIASNNFDKLTHTEEIYDADYSYASTGWKSIVSLHDLQYDKLHIVVSGVSVSLPRGVTILEISVGGNLIFSNTGTTWKDVDVIVDSKNATTLGIGGTHKANSRIHVKIEGLKYYDLENCVNYNVKDISDLDGVCLAAWATQAGLTIDHTRSLMSYSIAKNNLGGGKIEVTANPMQSAIIYFTQEYIDNITSYTFTHISHFNVAAGTTRTIAIPSNAGGMIINATPSSFHSASLYFPSSCKVYCLADLEAENENAIKIPTWINLGRIYTEVSANAQTSHQPADPNGNIYFPCIIRTRHAGALGKYYLYYSYDHKGGSGNNVGIKMAYSDDLMNWICYGNVLKAKTQFGLNTEQETETPCVVWDDRNNRYLMYWHSGYDYTGMGYAQTTYISASVDGITWTYIKAALDTPLVKMVGDGLDGYWTTRKRNGYYSGEFLLGGGNDPAGGFGISIDGLTWSLTNQIKMGYAGMFALNGTSLIGNTEYVASGTEVAEFSLMGKYFKISAVGKAASGTDPKEYNIAIQELFDDYFTPKDSARIIHYMSTDAGETTNIRNIKEFIDDDGSVYIIYNTANDAVTQTDFFLAKIILK